MKSKTLRIITISQLTIFLLLLCLTLGNEIIDIPHYVFHDAPTLYSQRTGEIIIELSIFFIVMVFEAALLKNLYKRIRLLEGFIPICANCKKIKNTDDQWEHIEQYITKHSLAQFSHGICPDCTRKLYPELYKDET
jgi:hypothetical protein